MIIKFNHVYRLVEKCAMYSTKILLIKISYSMYWKKKEHIVPTMTNGDRGEADTILRLCPEEPVSVPG